MSPANRRRVGCKQVADSSRVRAFAEPSRDDDDDATVGGTGDPLRSIYCCDRLRACGECAGAAVAGTSNREDITMGRDSTQSHSTTNERKIERGARLPNELVMCVCMCVCAIVCAFQRSVGGSKYASRTNEVAADDGLNQSQWRCNGVGSAHGY